MTRVADRPTGPATVLVDTHCHLDAAASEGASVAELLARARRAGVTRVVTIGTDLPASRRAVEMASRHDGVWATVGIDPNDVGGFDDGSVAEIAALAASPRVVAVGEIGLDYHWDRHPRERQREAFRAQLDLADGLGLPVVIHSRDAHDDTHAILEAWVRDRATDGPAGVMHCFSGDLPLARALSSLGFLISLAGNVTYRNARDLHAVAAQMPLDSLLVETDAPYLAPQPRRGSRNEPAFLPHTAEAVAALRGTTVDEVARHTTRNAERVFALRETAA